MSTAVPGKTPQGNQFWQTAAGGTPSDPAFGGATSLKEGGFRGALFTICSFIQLPCRCKKFILQTTIDDGIIIIDFIVNALEKR